MINAIKKEKNIWHFFAWLRFSITPFTRGWIQKDLKYFSLRVKNFHEIGYNLQKHIYFTMLWHFSFGELNQEKSIQQKGIATAVNFLCSAWLDPEQLLISYHPNNREMIDIWINSWILLKNCEQLDVWHNANFLKNFSWFRTKIWILQNQYKMYFWDIVFLKNFQDNLIIMDSGMALERLYMITEKNNNSFDTSYWKLYIMQLESIIWCIDKNILYRIADCIKSSLMILQSWVIVSHKKQWFVVKKLIKELVILLNNYPFTQINSIIQMSIQYFNINTEISEQFLEYYCYIDKNLHIAKKRIMQDIVNQNIKTPDFYQETYGFPMEWYYQLLWEYQDK